MIKQTTAWMDSCVLQTRSGFIYTFQVCLMSCDTSYTLLHPLNCDKYTHHKLVNQTLEECAPPIHAWLRTQSKLCYWAGLTWYTAHRSTYPFQCHPVGHHYWVYLQGLAQKNDCFGQTTYSCSFALKKVE